MDSHINAFGAVNSGPKKKVLFIITQSELGGAQQFILQFISQAKKESYDFTVAVGANGDRSLADTLASMNINVCTLPSLKRNISPFSDLLSIRQIKKLIQKIEPDTLFLSSSKAGFIGSLAAQSCNPRPKVIYRIGGWSFNDPRPNWQKSLWRFLEKLSARWKDIIIVNNNHDLNQAKEMGIKPTQDVVLIHNGLDPYKIDFLSRDGARVKLGLSLEPKIIGTIANFYPAKGLEYLIDAAAQLKQENILWCIIGNGTNKAKFEKLIGEKNLKDKVFLASRREPAASFLNAFDLFLLPSVKEGFPWAVLEAMAAKLPIIATRVGAVPEIIQDGTNGFIIEPRNPDQIAGKVMTLLNNESRAKEMGIQAHQRLLFAFNIDSTIRQIEKLI
ncbi:MAG: glycosyltransferase family 4 protein [Candidatus Pacebacteria bacterium]|nr:glycosyltransferase family 4 protein [Candidatus Paceibacterota bacterium]